ncbi:tape measure protein [bacterium]|jgi:tape measure domain-containing protein|nr:tape measure protein [bacterium]
MAKDFPVKTTFTAVDKMSQVLGRMQNRVQAFSAKAAMSMRHLDRTLSRAREGLTRGLKTGFYIASAGAVALGGAVGWVMKQFSKVEDAQANFTPLMGSVERAKELVAALNDTAATTPFEFENLAGVAQTLLPVMGGDIQKVIGTLRMMGDTAGGNAEKMHGIAFGFTKAMLKGKVDMESLNIIGEKGVPIIKELGDMYGVTTAQVLDMVRKGKIGTGDLTKAFERMTGKGGIFYKGMDIASKTLTGLLSTLRDVVSLTAADIGAELAPTVKDLVDWAIKAGEKMKVWVVANKELIRTKINEFVKEIPKWLERIAYWAPKIGILIATFYGISAAVKVASVATSAFNMAVTAAGYVGKLKPLASFLGTQLPAQIGVSTAAAGGLSSMLAKVGLVGGAAVAGWMIGTVIYNQVIKPLQDAQIEAKRLRQDLDDTMKRDISKRSAGQLSKDVAGAKKLIAIEKKAVSDINREAMSRGGMGVGSLFGGFSGGGYIGDLEEKKRKLESAWAVKNAQANISRYKDESSYSDVAPWEDAPVMSSSKETREVVEVTLKDETGRARVTRGKSGRAFKLAHTGAVR